MDDYNQTGVINDIEWSTKFIGDKDFELKVGNKTEIYTCEQPLLFGMDVWDVNALNRRLDEMQEEVEKEMKL